MRRPAVPPARREAGYAVIAAMVCAAGFALTAAQLTATSRSAALTAAAEAARAKLDADAEAGEAIALDRLQAADPQSRWTLGAEPVTLDFDDAELTIRVEDERGKIPLNTITPAQAKAMFQLAGAAPADADALAAALVLQRDAGSGAQPGQATAPGVPDATRAVGLTATRDLRLLPGMTPALYAALAASVSVSVRDAAFEPRTAAPLALEVMGAAAPGSAALIERQRELAGERTALDTAPPLVLAGRPLTLRVQVRDARGDRLERAVVVELTRSPDRPYVVHRLSTDGAPA